MSPDCLRAVPGVDLAILNTAPWAGESYRQAPAVKELPSNVLARLLQQLQFNNAQDPGLAIYFANLQHTAWHAGS